MPAGFCRHLVGKALKTICMWFHFNTLCWQVSDHTDTFLNILIEFYLNKMINHRPLTPHIIPHIPTKWRSYCDHRLCDVTLPYMYSSGKLLSHDAIKLRDESGRQRWRANLSSRNSRRVDFNALRQTLPAEISRADYCDARATKAVWCESRRRRHDVEPTIKAQSHYTHRETASERVEAVPFVDGH